MEALLIVLLLCPDGLGFSITGAVLAVLAALLLLSQDLSPRSEPELWLELMLCLLPRDGVLLGLSVVLWPRTPALSMVLAVLLLCQDVKTRFEPVPASSALRAVLLVRMLLVGESSLLA